MFNVRVFKYSDTGFQIRIYDEFQQIPYDDTVDNTPWYTTPKIRRQLERGKEFMYNPFSEQFEWIPQCDYYDSIEIDEVKRAERSARNSMCRSKNMIFYLARSNNWEWFLTLTFNPEKVDSFSYEEVTKKLSKWLNNAKRKCPDMKYLVVPEQHKSGRWHFHGLFSNCDSLGFVDSGFKTKKDETIYNVDVYRLGFSTATKITDTEKVSKYISKYITKEVCLSTKGKRRYWCSKNLDKAEIQDSLLSGPEKEKFIQLLADKIVHIKHTGSAELGLGVTYIELVKGVDFDL